MSRQHRLAISMGNPAAPFKPNALVNFLASALVRLGWVKEQKYKDKGWDSYAENLQFKAFKLRYFFSSAKYMDQLRQKTDEVRTVRLFQENYKKLQARSRSTSHEVTFKHSGNAGDIVYALPTIRALCNGRPAKLFLNLDAPINGWSKEEHPCGKSGLTADMTAFLRPMLEHQSWVSSAPAYQNETVDYDLDIFRQIHSAREGRGHNAHWYFWVFPVSVDLSKPWLELAPPVALGKKIVLARSVRYRNPHLDYAFLRDKGEIDFVGIRSEFEEMRQVLPQLRHVECSDALQLANVIKSARFFIGNQSFPYAIAEALKVPRILEICPYCPVAMPQGENAGEAFFQPNFEKLVEKFWEQTGSTPSTGHMR